MSPPNASPVSPVLRISIRRKVVLGFGLVLAMLGLIALISFQSTRAFINTADWVARTREVMEVEQQTFRYLMEMESGRRGYLITGEDDFLNGYEEAKTKITRNLEALKRSTLDTPQQTLKLNRLQRLLARSFALQRAEMDVRRARGFKPSAALFAEGDSDAATVNIRDILKDFDREQRALLTERAALTRLVGNATTMAILSGSTLTFIALVVACWLILRDIAARRRAEGALAAEHNLLLSIIDTIPDHVFVKDRKGRFMLDNVAHRRLLAQEGHGETTGRTVYDYFTVDEAERFDDDDRYVIETGERILNREESVPRDDGSELWLATTKVPLRDIRGRTIGLVGISSDISERKGAEEQLRRFTAQLERSNSELQNFASVASHDLQEPLRKIQAFADRLRTKCGSALNAQGLDYLSRIENAAQRMQVLIQDLLKLSRITSRALPFEKCNLRAIVSAVLCDLEVAIEQNRAHVEAGWLPEIEADSLQMRQLFQNLISNALKFQRPGERPVISISSRLVDPSEPFYTGGESGASCEISVRDNGIGFEPRFTEQIFVVFQRLHSRSEYEGTGIGLAVCRKITDRHGGRIVAKSAPGEGATFIVTLPLKQPSETAHD